LQSVDYLPGLRSPFSPLNLCGAALPTRWWNPGLCWSWEWRKTAYFNQTCDVISSIPFFLGRPLFYTGSLNVTEQLLKAEGKSRLIKPPELNRALLMWGEGVISANGETWKRHRRIVAPAFTSKTYSLVWQETAATYKEMVAGEGWESCREITITDSSRLTQKAGLYLRYHGHIMALIIISRCGFGLHMPWVEAGTGELSFGDALTVVSQTHIARLITPRWAYKLPIKKLRDIDHAWSMLATYMENFVQLKKDELSQVDQKDDTHQRGDIFTRLVAAHDGDGKYGLDKDEVIGNTFTLMFAGHETTANVLAATLGYLGIHQEEQHKAYEEIQSAISSDRNPTMEDAVNLPHTLACFLETLRLFPAGFAIMRDVTEDTLIQVSHPAERTMVLRKGSRMVIDMIGVHHDPKVFPEPRTYRPSRWYGVSEHDIPMFGIGPRACIGQKFARAEALCFLVLLLRDWKVDVVLEEGESRDRYEERVMGKAGLTGMAFGVTETISLKLERRLQTVL
ncbi:cytochrome P450, partial [Leucogyrophana mollusca]